MKEHIPTFAALAALLMVLTAVIVLVTMGQKPADMAMLGLGTAIGTIVSGFSPSFSRAPNPGAKINSDSTGPAGQKEPQ